MSVPGMDPKTQYLQLVDNLTVLKQSIEELLSKFGIQIPNVPGVASPCAIAQTLSKQVCSIQDLPLLETLTSQLDTIQGQLTEVAQQAAKDSEALTVQQGGDPFQYIVNPMTGKKERLNSAIGKALVHQYLSMDKRK